MRPEDVDEKVLLNSPAIENVSGFDGIDKRLNLLNTRYVCFECQFAYRLRLTVELSKEYKFQFWVLKVQNDFFFSFKVIRRLSSESFTYTT